jgi:hypothetical protein
MLLTAIPGIAQSPPAETSDPPDHADHGAPPADAAPPQRGSQPAGDVEELKRRVDLLAAEVERLRSGEEQAPTLSDEERRALGLAPSAAATYRKHAGISFAGYGEMLYENVEEGAPEIDFLRAVLYTGYRFNDRFVFNSEIEFEHGGEEIGIEFAYLDYRLNDSLSLRGGNVLMPLGLVNEFHEPNVFIGAQRPETERRIIPTTWHENGFGVLGSHGRFSYRAYFVNGFDASGFTAEGLRDGRQGGVEAIAADWALVGRLDVTPVAGAFAGIGVYRGDSAQGEFGDIDAGTTIFEFHGQAQIRGFDLRGLFARATVDDAAGLNRALGFTRAQSIGSTLDGGYLQVGYNVLSQYVANISLLPYYRFEKLNTQAEVPTGFLADPATDETFHTLGVELKPIPNVVVKFDYQWISDAADASRNRANVNLGYAF